MSQSEMKQPMTARKRKLTPKQRVLVRAKCIGCGATRDIGAGAIAEDDHPCCTQCGMPMIADAAKRLA